MTINIYYIIRHKQTSELMPQMLRGRGYTHWNPNIPDRKKIVAELDIPRLMMSRKQAEKVIRHWVAMPNAQASGYQSSTNEWVDDISTKEDGRKADDLEILEITLKERTNDSKAAN